MTNPLRELGSVQTQFFSDSQLKVKRAHRSHQARVEMYGSLVQPCTTARLCILLRIPGRDSSTQEPENSTASPRRTANRTLQLLGVSVE